MISLLLITYYFPPCGGAAVQRWLRLLPELVKAGFRITVITTQDGDYPTRDETLWAAIPSEVNVIRTKTPVFGKFWRKLTGKNEPIPYGSLNSSSDTPVIKKLMFWLRLNLIFPDARVIWNPYARKEALKQCRENRFDWVITSGPPHSTHLIGYYLKKHIRIKWMTDFRDPWSKIYYLDMEKQNAAIRFLTKKWERKVIQAADQNLIVSQHIADTLPPGKKRILYNGFAESDFADQTYVIDDKFRIKYIGQLTAGQNIKAIFDLLQGDEISNLVSKVEFSFVGTNPESIPKTEISLRQTGFISHMEAIKEMVQCELLILLINEYTGSKGMLTTKLFEYIASRTPIICLGPLEGEAAAIIKEVQAGLSSPVVTPEVVAFFKQLYDAWAEGCPQRTGSDISKWSVRQQISVLKDILLS